MAIAVIVNMTRLLAGSLRFDGTTNDERRRDERLLEKVDRLAPFTTNTIFLLLLTVYPLSMTQWPNFAVYTVELRSKKLAHGARAVRARGIS
jgi:hypothetical protein